MNSICHVHLFIEPEFFNPYLNFSELCVINIHIYRKYILEQKIKISHQS